MSGEHRVKASTTTPVEQCHAGRAPSAGEAAAALRQRLGRCVEGSRERVV